MLVAMSATIFSCGEDEKEEVAPVEILTPYEEAVANLTGNTWHYMRLITDNGPEDTFECSQKSDTYFKSDGVYEFVYDEVCDQEGTYTGSWEMPEDMKTFTFISADGSRSEYILIEITDSRLLIEIPEIENDVSSGWQKEYIAE